MVWAAVLLVGWLALVGTAVALMVADARAAVRDLRRPEITTPDATTRATPGVQTASEGPAGPLATCKQPSDHVRQPPTEPEEAAP